MHLATIRLLSKIKLIVRKKYNQGKDNLNISIFLGITNNLTDNW